MNRLLPALILPALWLLSLPLTAQTATPVLRIAVVDQAAIFAAHPSTEEATAKLTKTREELQLKFKEKTKELKELLQKHQELIRAQKRTEAAELLKKANEIEKAIATMQTTQKRDLEEQFRKAKTGILIDIQTHIAEFNAEGAFALVLDKSATSAQGLPHIVHSPGAVDITDEVLAHIREKHAQ